MSKLYKFSGDINRALKTVNSEIEKHGYEYVTWSNTQTGSRFIAEAATVIAMYKEKFEKGPGVDQSKVVKLSNTGMTISEIEETGGGTVKQGFAGKDSLTIDTSKLDLLKEVLYNKDFDCSILFR